MNLIPQSELIRTQTETCIKSCRLYSSDDIINISIGREFVDVVYTAMKYSNFSGMSMVENGIQTCDEHGNIFYTGFGASFNLQKNLVHASFFVHPLYRRRGFGRELVKVTEEISKSLGMYSVSIFDPNEDFFKSIGYMVDDNSDRKGYAHKYLMPGIKLW